MHFMVGTWWAELTRLKIIILSDIRFMTKTVKMMPQLNKYQLFFISSFFRARRKDLSEFRRKIKMRNYHGGIQAFYFFQK